MKILKFIKKNYRKIIIQIVAIISAFFIFCFSASAYASDTVIIPTYNAWCTNFSIRNGDFSGTNWGSVLKTYTIQNFPYYPPWGDIFDDSTWRGYLARYPHESNSIEIKGNYIVMTWLLDNNQSSKFIIRGSRSYRVTIPLCFEFSTSKSVDISYAKLRMWSDSNPSKYQVTSEITKPFTMTPYLQEYPDGNLYHSSKLLQFDLEFDLDSSFSPRYFSIALKVSNSLKLWQGNAVGFDNNIIFEDFGQTYISKDGIVSISNSLSVVSGLLNKILNLSSFSSIITFSCTIGLCAFILGVGPSLLRGLGHKTKPVNSHKKESG